MFAPTLRGYRRAWLSADLVAGLTVGAMLVPQAMAYAELAGLPPSIGFQAALAPLIVYALVGGSRHLGVGPEPGTAVLAAAGVGLVAGGDPNTYVALMAALALLVGAVALIAAALRLGVLADLLSKPVLVGYITGVGLTLVSSQLAKGTGVPVSGDDFFSRFASFFGHLDLASPTILAVFGGALALILILKRTSPRVPAALTAVLLATLFAELANLGVPRVGEVAALSLVPSLPAVAIGDVLALVPTALGIALVGYTDNVLTARSVASRHGYKVDPQRELVALGATNTAAGFFGGFPVSSSASRTAVPSSLGSHSQLVGLVAALFVVLALTLAPGVLAAMPSAALAAVIVSAAIAIIDVEGYRRLWRVSRQELGLAVVAALAVMVFDVLVGVLIAFVLSVVLLVRRLSRPHDTTLALDPSRGGWVDARQYGLPPTFVGLLVYRFDAPLFFGNIERFRQRLTESLRDNPGEERWVVLDLEGVGEVDATALDGLRELVGELSAKGQVVATARANPRVLEALGRGGILEAGLRPFPTIHAAVEAFRAVHPDHPVETPPGV